MFKTPSNIRMLYIIAHFLVQFLVVLSAGFLRVATTFCREISSSLQMCELKWACNWPPFLWLQ